MDKKLFNIIGIDPGNNLGIAIYTIDPEDFKIVKFLNKVFSS